MPTQPETLNTAANAFGTNPNASLATAAANQMLVRQMSPLYRARAEAFNESLPASVDLCLKTYFKDLNGMSPANGMYVKVISQVEKPLIEHVLRYVRCNQVRAANILGINRNTLRKKIQSLNIDLVKIMGDVGAA
ncbi:MAG: helix-turn-helix domain-containing protein [Pseudomonadota bacterium]|jgi:Fis family transcriptional regulator